MQINNMLSRIYIYKKEERNKKIKLMKIKKDKKKKEMEWKKYTISFKKRAKYTKVYVG